MSILSISLPVEARLFPDLYEQLLWKLARTRPHMGFDPTYIEERNERTGHVVRVLPYPTSFVLDLSAGHLPVAGNRKLFPGTAAAEVAWQLLGTQDPTFMMRHAKVVWEKFLEDNPDQDAGAPATKIIKAAYGYRWRKHFGRDQLKLAIEALRRNPSDRRVWVGAWDPSEDGLGAAGQLNVPCPVGFSLAVVDSRLNCSLMIRSSDVFVGLPYDVMGQSMLMAIVAEELEVGLGHLHVTLGHAHLYDSHFEDADASLRWHYKATKVPLVGLPVDILLEDPDAYVAEYKRLGAATSWPDFCPRPDVIP